MGVFAAFWRILFDISYFKQTVFLMQFYALFLARFVFGAFCRKRGEEGADYKGEGESSIGTFRP